MNSNHRAIRPLLLVGIAAFAIAVASSGCSWIKNKTNYQSSKEGNPLEMPPGLDMPDTSAATGLPLASSAGVASSAPLSTKYGHLDVSAAEAFPKVGDILNSTPGVVVNGSAEALSSYDVTYKGESFLLRVLDATGGSRMVALSADGRMLNAGAPAELIASIKAKF